MDVEGDGVAFADGGDGAAELGFGGDVAGHQPARGSGETPVGEKGDGVGELGDSLDGGSDGEHFAHAGAAAGAFVADDEDVVGVDLAGLRRRRGRCLRTQTPAQVPYGRRARGRQP